MQFYFQCDQQSTFISRLYIPIIHGLKIVKSVNTDIGRQNNLIQFISRAIYLDSCNFCPVVCLDLLLK